MNYRPENGDACEEIDQEICQASGKGGDGTQDNQRSEEYTSELQSLRQLVCRLLLEKKKNEEAEALLKGALFLVTYCEVVLVKDVDMFSLCVLLFFFMDGATPEIYTLSLHDALPI